MIDVYFNLETITHGHHNATYRGIKIIKNPFDYMLYQMILNEVKPDLVIEIGTNNGGTALYMADVMDMYSSTYEIHTIDIVSYNTNPLIESHKRIKKFLNGFDAYDMSLAAPFNTILVIDDGSHTYRDVKRSLNKFKDLVSLNSYFIVEDGILNNLGLENSYEGGPYRAVHEFLSETDDYIIDRKWCDFFGKNATFNPDGYLKKIKK
jgi:cephalosporin hydroxylase